MQELLFRGHPEVVDADLAEYFGSIPYADLLKSVARRIVDRRVQHLIKMWLECPVADYCFDHQKLYVNGPRSNTGIAPAK
ncbi:MAG TPA: hypothetical protein VK670_15210 [Silvibacterium sp.]|nr:hypothetical protein [Silvibacterium sp.]